MTINAWSQGGGGYSGTPLIALNGTSDDNGKVNGLTITAAAVTVEGLAVENFTGDGIDLVGAGSTRDVIQGNYIGTDVNGSHDQANGFYGLYVTSANNTITGNTISANDDYGLYLSGGGTPATSSRAT